jgi:hypothetical protein
MRIFLCLILAFAVFTPLAFANHGVILSYLYQDSNESFAFGYSWIDASTGTMVNFPNNTDDDYATLNIPFDIKLFGTMHPSGSHLYVGTNGMVGFSPTNMISPTNQNLPNVLSPNNLMAAYWDDLMGYTGDHVFQLITGTSPNRIWTIMFNPWHNKGQEVYGIAFEISIVEDLYGGDWNNIVAIQFKDTISQHDDYGASATCGIENPNGSLGHSYCYDSANLTQNLRVDYWDILYATPTNFALTQPQNGAIIPVFKGTGEADLESVKAQGAPEDSYKVDVPVLFQWNVSNIPLYTNYYPLYNLEIDNNSDFSSVEISINSISNTSYEYIFSVLSGETWYWRVTAVNPHYSTLIRPCDQPFHFTFEYNLNVQPSSLGKVKACFQ